MSSSGLFQEFVSLAEEIQDNASYTAKTEIIAKFLKSFHGDRFILFRFLLVKECDKRVYNLKEKQMAKILSRCFPTTMNLQEILDYNNQHDMPKTIQHIFVKSGRAASKSTLTLKQVDDLLEELNGTTTEEAQVQIMKKVFEKASGKDVFWIWKLIDHDLKINIGAKFAMAALHPKAFPQFQKTNNLREIITLSETNQLGKKEKKVQKNNSFSSAGIIVKNPIKPMLAKATKDLDTVYKLCPNEIYCEIKYDGERIQIHKEGDEFEFFSRNLKKMLETKTGWIKEWIPKCTTADSIILDGEILLIDTKTHKPLPFGTLGVHKQKGFQDGKSSFSIRIEESVEFFYHQKIFTLRD